MTTPTAGRLRFRKAAFCLALVVLLLCLGESLLRSGAPIHLAGIQSTYIYDDELGVRLDDGVQALKLSDHLEEIRTNELGTVNFQQSFEAYESRVFALGDSYTQGTGLPPDASYPFQLDLRLNLGEDGLYHRSYAVVNLGLAAYGAEQSLIALRRYAERLGAPQVCLYLGSENDYRDDLLFRAGYRHRHIVRGSPRWGWMAEPLLWAGEFELVKRLKIAASQWLRREILAPDTGAAVEPGTPRTSVAELSWPAIEKIRSACESYGALLILSWTPGDSPSYAWLRTRAANEGIAFADWWPAVESIRQAAPDIPLANPHSGGHWRTWVNRLIADAFAREIKRASDPEPAGN